MTDLIDVELSTIAEYLQPGDVILEHPYPQVNKNGGLEWLIRLRRKVDKPLPETKYKGMEGVPEIVRQP
jgi:hypothetical protein